MYPILPHCLNFWLMLVLCKIEPIGDPIRTNFADKNKVHCSSILEMANICTVPV